MFIHLISVLHKFIIFENILITKIRFVILKKKQKLVIQ